MTDTTAPEGGRTLLVTGASGLIGSALADVLSAGGDTVIAIVRPGTPQARVPSGCVVHELDLASPFTRTDLPGHKYDAVVHLAQHANYDAFPADAGKLAELNVAATCRLAEVAVELGARQFLFASSGGIYRSSKTPVDEQAPVSPPTRLGFYLTAKAATEQLLASFREYLEVTFLRYFFVYGPRQQDRFLLPRLVQRVRAGETITAAGGRGPLINPIHVNDAARATAACIRPAAPDVVNVAGPTVASIREISEIVSRFVGRSPVFDESDSEPEDIVGDITRMRSLYEPELTLDQGLKELCDAGRSDH
jgi:UDP-glucose 4-epimerase